MTDIRTQMKIYSSGYNDLIHLRAAITSIPFIGSQLDLYLSTPGQKFVEERLQYLIDRLQEQMTKIEESAIDKTLFDTEEGFDLVNKTFAAAARTRQRQKLTVFAQILKGALTKQMKNYNPELYLRIVDELTERELGIAMALYNLKTTKKAGVDGVNEDRQGINSDAVLISKYFPEYLKEEVEFTLIRLEKTGLIKEVVGMYFDYSGGQYNPTPLFSDFVQFIEQEEKENTK